MRTRIDRDCLRVMAQVAVWVTIPVTVAAICNDWIARDLAARALHRPGAPATKSHDPVTCQVCRRNGPDSLRNAAELGAEATVEYPEGHPLKGHEDLFIGK